LSPTVRRLVVGINMLLSVADSRGDCEEGNGASDNRPVPLCLCQ